jgi:hypothetical protein
MLLDVALFFARVPRDFHVCPSPAMINVNLFVIEIIFTKKGSGLAVRTSVGAICLDNVEPLKSAHTESYIRLEARCQLGLSHTSNSHFGPSGCHIVMAGPPGQAPGGMLVPAIHRGTVLRGWPEQVRP